MSPSRWWGHDPVVETVFEYDEQGRVSRTLAAPVEPEWSADDRALMLALAEHEASICPGCGQYHDEAQDPERRWDVSGPFEDFACQALSRYSKQWSGGGRDASGREIQPHPYPESLRYAVRARG